MNLVEELRAISRPVRERKTNQLIDSLMERLQLRAGAGFTTLSIPVEECMDVERVRQWFRDKGVNQCLNTDQKTGLETIYVYW